MRTWCHCTGRAACIRPLLPPGSRDMCCERERSHCCLAAQSEHRAASGPWWESTSDWAGSTPSRCDWLDRSRLGPEVEWRGWDRMRWQENPYRWTSLPKCSRQAEGGQSGGRDPAARCCSAPHTAPSPGTPRPPPSLPPHPPAASRLCPTNRSGSGWARSVSMATRRRRSTGGGLMARRRAAGRWSHQGKLTGPLCPPGPEWEQGREWEAMKPVLLYQITNLSVKVFHFHILTNVWQRMLECVLSKEKSYIAVWFLFVVVVTFYCVYQLGQLEIHNILIPYQLSDDYFVYLMEHANVTYFYI